MFGLAKPAMIYKVQSSHSSSTDVFSSIPSLSEQITGTCSPSLIRANQQQLVAHYRTLASQFKKLTQQSSPLEKSNYLRVTILKFLRFDQHPIERHDPDLSNAIDTFSKYWNFLLIDLINHGSLFSYTDRSCYLEVISRLMSRKEWKLILGPNENLIYQNLLISTLYYVQKKLLHLKKISNSINSFIGKLQSFSFFSIPHFADIILFSLEISNETMRRYKPDTSNSIKLQNRFPEHLSKYFDYTGTSSYILSENSKQAGYNCLPAPSDLALQITNNDISDSILVINPAQWGLPPLIKANLRSISFLKHYLEYCVASTDPTSEYQSFISGIPGGHFIFAAIFQVIFSDYNTLCAIKTSNLIPARAMPSVQGNFYHDATLQENMFSQKRKNVNKYQLLLQSLMTTNKIFQVVKDLLCDSKINHLVYSEVILVTSLESLLVNIARTIVPYHRINCGVINDLFTRICSYLYDKDFELNKTKLLDWGFWLTGISRMLESDSMGSQKSAISCLFNLWELIPSSYIIKNSIYAHERWVFDLECDLITNLSLYLISKPIWEIFFIHWSELIRHLYQKLIIFKVISTKDKNDLKYFTDFIVKDSQDSVEDRLLESFDIFFENFDPRGKMVASYELFPSEPVLNQKIIIAPMHKEKQQPLPIDMLKEIPHNLLGKLSTSRLNPVYPYDVFDEAIYTSAQSKSPGNASMDPLLTPPSMFGFSHSPSPIKKSMSSKSLTKIFDLIGSPSSSSTFDAASKLTKIVQRSSPNLSKSNFLQRTFRSSSSLNSLSSFTAKSGSSSSLNLQDISMSTIPPPPELNKTRSRVMYKYAFLLVPNPEGISSKRKEEILKSSTRKFWTLTDIFGSSANTPSLPRLPFLNIVTEFSKLDDLKAQIYTKRLLNCRKNLGSSQVGEYDFNFLRSNSGLDVHQNRDIGISKTIPISCGSNPSNNQLSQSEEPELGLKNRMFESMKNYAILGRALNEWDLNVQEYEKFVSLVTEDFENPLFADDEVATWLPDPFLDCENGIFKGAY